MINYGVGDMYSPNLDEKALEEEINDFINSLINNSKPLINNFEDGRNIVQVLELQTNR